MQRTRNREVNLSTRHADQVRRRWGLTVRPLRQGTLIKNVPLTTTSRPRSTEVLRKADMHRKCYASEMKSTTLPPVRIEPEFRAAAESVLHESESLTGFIEATVRRAVEY